MTEPAATSPWEALRSHLLAARAELFRALREYPPPIAGCDQQFNRLLELREQVAAELRRLDDLAAQCGQAAPADALEAVLRDSAFVDSHAAARIRSVAAGG